MGFNHPVSTGLLRVLKKQISVGAAFMVTREIACMCRHVAAQVAGTPQHSSIPPGTVIPLELPFAQTRLRGEVTSDLVHPPGSEEGESSASDLVLLRIVDDPMPEALRPLPLISTDGIYGRALEAIGFPSRSYERAEARAFPAGGHLVQLDPPIAGGRARIRKGYSGAPVWDPERKGVVGMIVEGLGVGPIHTSYMMTSEHMMRLAGPTLSINHAPAQLRVSEAEVQAQRWIESNLQASSTPRSAVEGSLAGVHYLIAAPVADRNLQEINKIMAWLGKRGARGIMLDANAIPVGVRPLQVFDTALRMSHFLLLCISVAGPSGERGDAYASFAESAIQFMLDERLESRILPIEILPRDVAQHHVSDFWMAAIRPARWSSEGETELVKLEAAMKFWRRLSDA